MRASEWRRTILEQIVYLCIRTLFYFLPFSFFLCLFTDQHTKCQKMNITRFNIMITCFVRQTSEFICFNQTQGNYFISIYYILLVSFNSIIITRTFLLAYVLLCDYNTTNISNIYLMQKNEKSFKPRLLCPTSCWVSLPILQIFLLGQFTSFSKLTKINCPICLYKLSK